MFARSSLTRPHLRPTESTCILLLIFIVKHSKLMLQTMLRKSHMMEAGSKNRYQLEISKSLPEICMQGFSELRMARLQSHLF